MQKDLFDNIKIEDCTCKPYEDALQEAEQMKEELSALSKSVFSDMIHSLTGGSSINMGAEIRVENTTQTIYDGAFTDCIDSIRRHSRISRFVQYLRFVGALKQKQPVTREGLNAIVQVVADMKEGRFPRDGSESFFRKMFGNEK